jgi:hypothetical protein
MSTSHLFDVMSSAVDWTMSSEHNTGALDPDDDETSHTGED